jgi:hypothetical protein
MTITAAERPVTIRQMPFHSVEESDDGRWYIIDGQRLMSVTTALKSIAKWGLPPWAGKLAAEAAFAELPTVVASSRIKPCGNTHSRCGHDWREPCERCPCGRCKACVTKWLADRHIAETARRADEGTRTHKVIDWWSKHGEIRGYDPDIAPYVQAFEAYTAEYGLVPDSILMSEAILIHRDINAAGQTDGITRFHAERTQPAAKLVSRVLQVPWRRAVKLRLTVDLIVDYKTREHEGPKFYPENALQVAGYRHFPTVRIKDTDHEEPLQATDGGLVVQLRPDGATPRLVKCDEHTYRKGFLNALGLYEWLMEDGLASVSSHTFVLPETVAARARKAAKQHAETTPTATPDL